VNELITCGYSIGLTVIATTSDMGSSNRAMWTKFGTVSDRGQVVNSFMHPRCTDQHIYVLEDVPHLIKNLRNHVVSGQKILLEKDIVQKFQLPSAIVSVEPLRQLVDYQSTKDLKPAPK